MLASGPTNWTMPPSLLMVALPAVLLLAKVITGAALGRAAEAVGAKGATFS
jgi:hypothetical protein